MVANAGGAEPALVNELNSDNHDNRAKPEDVGPQVGTASTPSVRSATLWP